VTFTFKLRIRLEGVNETHLPALIEMMRKAARLVHADVCLIVGKDPLPTIEVYGEDLSQEN
jgi:hypothetical protein